MRQIDKERTIGIHPKYRSSYARRFAPPAEMWERSSDLWDKGDRAGALAELTVLRQAA
jgi:hypothetical protein